MDRYTSVWSYLSGHDAADADAARFYLHALTVIELRSYVDKWPTGAWADDAPRTPRRRAARAAARRWRARRAAAVPPPPPPIDPHRSASPPLARTPVP